MSYLPKTVPKEFARDFKRDFSSVPEEEEGVVQCCQYPSRREEDRSTIIEFVHIPLDKQENLIKNNKRKSSQRISRNVQINRRDRNASYQTNYIQSVQQPTKLYHQDLGAQYVGIAQPANVVRTHQVSPTGSGGIGDCSSSSETSISTTNSVGFKYKTHLYNRYSSQIEEENRVLDQLLRKP